MHFNILTHTKYNFQDPFLTPSLIVCVTIFRHTKEPYIESSNSILFSSLIIQMFIISVADSLS